MPRVTEEHAEQRRRQILDAASRCFARKGLHRTTMKDIFAAAKLSPGSVYTWFPSKKAIIQEMTRRRLASFDDALRKADDDPRGAIADYLATVRQAAEDAPIGWMNLHLAAEAVRDRQVRDIMRQVVEGGSDVLERAFRRLYTRQPARARARARLLQAAAYGIVVQSLLAPDRAASFDLAEDLLAD